MHSGMVDSAVSNLLAPVDHVANYCYTQGKHHSGLRGTPYLQSNQ
jgi:hypothetical protein